MCGNLLDSKLFDDIFAFPAAGDNGLSAGAALACHFEMANFFVNKKFISTSLGRRYGVEQIENELSKWKNLISFDRQKDIHDSTSKLLAEGNVIGLFQGREEYGPRALGNRSIIADPRPVENRNKINKIVKLREDYRPFAPAIMQEYMTRYFQLPRNGQKSFPFMNFILNVKHKYREHLGAVTHIDGSARVQTVSKDENPVFWQFINAFYKRTKTPVLLNTSFNNSFEPIVHSPADVICFLLTSDIDYVVIEDYLIHKKSADQRLELFSMANFYDFISLFPNSKDSTKFYLFNSYSKNKIEISKHLWGFLSSKQPFDLSSNRLIVNEVKNIWRQRLIKINPILDILKS